jgi:hypothetical protein
VRCSDDPVVPVVDAVAAVGLVVAAAAVTIGVLGEDSGGVPPGVLAITASPALAGALFGVSAHHGFRATARCRQMKAAPITAQE